MGEHDLSELGNELAKAILDNKNVIALTSSIASIISYLQSEQDKRRQLANTMNDMQQEMKAHAGLIKSFEKPLWELEQMKDQSKRNGKLLWGVLGSVVGVIAIEVLKLAFGHH
jgi:hypothetical protein